MKIRNLLPLLFSIVFSSVSFAGHWTHPYPGTLPFDPFLVGYDNDGSPLYLCRAYFKGSYQPGKTWQHSDQCNIPYGGREYQIKQDFAIYKRTENSGQWVRGNGQIPQDALRVGTDSNDNPLFLCRAEFKKGLQPGKTWPGYLGCNIPYGGKEIVERDYSVFVTDDSWPRHHHWHRG